MTNCPKSRSLQCYGVIDATRVADGKVVAIKRVDKTYHPDETDITQFFSTEPLATHPHNHTIPLYDVFPSPLHEKYTFLVLPYLVLFGGVRFSTVGEVVGCLDQLFEVTDLCSSVALLTEDVCVHRAFNSYTSNE